MRPPHPDGGISEDNLQTLQTWAHREQIKSRVDNGLHCRNAVNTTVNEDKKLQISKVKSTES